MILRVVLFLMIVSCLPAQQAQAGWSVRQKIGQAARMVATAMTAAVPAAVEQLAKPLSLTPRPLGLKVRDAVTPPVAEARTAPAAQEARSGGTWAATLGLDAADTAQRPAARKAAAPAQAKAESPAKAEPATQAATAISATAESATAESATAEAATAAVPRRDKIIATQTVNNPTAEPRKRGVVSIARQQDKGAMVFTVAADQPVEYKTFLTADGKKRVIDLRGNWRYEGRPRLELDAQGPNAMRALRVGHHPDMLRLVFDYDAAEQARPALEATAEGLAIVFRMG